MAIILGIDPGLRITGYGVICQNDQKLTYLGSGCIRTKDNSLSICLKIIYTDISIIIAKFLPDFFVIEQIFMAKNPDAALKLGQARGAAIVSAVNHNLQIFEYTACHVKKTVVGIGNAKKNQVQHMVRVLLNLSTNIQEDAADALAISITHCLTLQNSIKICNK